MVYVLTRPSHHPSGAMCRCQKAAADGSNARPHFHHMLQRIRFWMSRRRQCQALADLDDHMLADIGITREAALREANKPFWA